MKRPFLVIGCMLLALGLAGPAPADDRAGAPRPPTTITGKLSVRAGQAPRLQAGQKAYRLVSADPDIAATLKDPRMNDRPVQLEGRLKGSDEWQVQHLFVARAGQRYRVIYYCEVCNLYDVKPGDCVCCQAPLELIEVPPEDTRGRGQ